MRLSPEAYLGKAKNIFSVGNEYTKSHDFSMVILELWKSEYKNLSFLLPHTLHPKIFIKPTFYPTLNDAAIEGSRYLTDPLSPSSSPLLHLMNFTGAVFLMHQV
ncbi:hypothetical protein HMI54_002548 [Coelomomyces lativittatus]|nr:hypothetical protein HMI54_002548 [Coelomomyces lativittatus]KAJ1512520.1 hypothetical protein HMI56_003958 [Coelomomyces lativittatus]KAJ1513104.1 hypothetical protein HMI55_005898 [Coelomomyces lativittatus]